MNFFKTSGPVRFMIIFYWILRGGVKFYPGQVDKSFFVTHRKKKISQTN